MRQRIAANIAKLAELLRKTAKRKAQHGHTANYNHDSMGVTLSSVRTEWAQRRGFSLAKYRQ
jgi:hypothetical protein